MVLDDAPDRVHAALLERAQRHDRWIPRRAGVAEEVQRGDVLRGGLLRHGDVLAVGLVDGERIGDLEDALLDALQLVAGARQHEHQEEVDHRVDGDLALADADGLDDDHVVARGLAHQHRLARPPRDAAERSARRARPDEGFGRGGQARHARLVAEDAAARPRARRIDGEHGDALPEADQVEAERLDEGALRRRPERP